MLGRFSGAVDNLRETPPDLTMVVDASKAQILERQMAELLDRLAHADLVVLNLLQQFSKLFSLNIAPALVS
jgi:hypothetical protein